MEVSLRDSVVVFICRHNGLDEFAFGVVSQMTIKLFVSQFAVAQWTLSWESTRHTVSEGLGG